mgnify:CR=1 FL=1
MGLFSNDDYIYLSEEIENIIIKSKNMDKEQIIEALKKALELYGN